jgi:hypothetical protein
MQGSFKSFGLLEKVLEEGFVVGAILKSKIPLWESLDTCAERIISINIWTKTSLGNIHGQWK